MGGVFITGATGNVGGRLVKEYLTATDHHLYLLVRGADQQDAEARIQRVLDFWEVGGPGHRERVTVCRGDMTAPDLGLAPAQLDDLRAHADCCIHAASNLRLDLTLDQARREILDATRRVLDLARSFQTLRRFGYLSTMEIMGRYEGVIREEYLTHHDIPFLNTYEVAKFEAEEYLREQAEAGVPVQIFRVSMVVGESDTGRIPRFQSFYLLTEKLVLAPDFPVVPDGAPIDAVPVDVLARALRAVLESDLPAGRIFHLSQGREDAVDFRRYREMVTPLAEAELGRRLKRPRLAPAAAFRGLFRLLGAVTRGRTRRFFRVQRIFLGFFDLPGTFDNARTREALRPLGVQWPRFADYLPNLLRYYLAHRHERRFPF